MTMLPVRSIGGIRVSAIGLGCMNLSHAYGETPSEAEGARLLNHALDQGVTLLDTAALYGGGANERLIAKAVMHRRGEFVLASKCVLDLHDGKRGLDGSPAAIARTLDGALQRLGTDHIDLYYLHRLDARVPIEESVGALVRAKEAGKIGAIGLSEMGAETIRRAYAVHPVAAVQSEYSPVVRNPEIAVLDTCRELGIGFVAFSPVARGLLAGAVRSDDYVEGDIRRNMPRFTGDNLRHNLAAVSRFEALAADAGVTPAQLALAWVLSRGEQVVPIPGTRSIAHLDEDLAAATLSLEPALLEKASAVFAAGTIRGARYAAPMQAQIDTETFADEELA
ncbi:aldo/keto reductase [Sphingomonas baiyangensis]|uniref:Aldo/keto reductase n=1 Tax=Sphingomonas baiyangensis TaxID=2572576 RepID=A0A4U1L7V3_9SPHN|nr:aldo/keto reductase [Sphingomonas baiyangensis]TKD53019.1 aldo/keto reductase [Sphingomonas baiyangensis]